MPTAYYDVYAKELSRYKHGHPLWWPDPDPDYGPVNLGDVGILQCGTFRVLFNTLGLGLAQKQLPANFEPFALPKERPLQGPRRVDAHFITMRTMHGSSIHNCKISGGVSVGGMPGGVGTSLEFQCNRASGALLFLGSDGLREHLDCGLCIKKYMTKNLPDWYAYAKDNLQMEVHEEDIVFVSGFIKTAVYAAASFCHENTKISTTFSGCCTLPGVASGSAALAVQVSDAQGLVPTMDTRASPPELAAKWGNLLKEEVKDPRQCVFLEYYRMKRRSWFIKRIEAGAGPHELPPLDPPSGSSPTPASEETVVSEHDWLSEEYGLDLPQPCNMLDNLLEGSHADIAIASHADLTALGVTGLNGGGDVLKRCGELSLIVTEDRGKSDIDVT
ncbi:hypothetical protein C8Q76DRAFT_800461 [Earliella scabrosa]|nr:hypothetical protein C8Q76DRAFT_800461 [Earliella scabrosa]